MSKPTQPPLASGVCNYCHEQSDVLSFCGRCRIGRYCSTLCQKKHWAKHKTVCKIHLEPKDNPAPIVPVEGLSAFIAVYLSQQRNGEMLPIHLYSPIVRKVQKSELETLVYLGRRSEESINPSIYDLTATTPEQSSNSWSRMFAINWGNKICRAVGLGLTLALLGQQLKLEINGRTVTAVTMYNCEPKVPFWTLMPTEPYPGQTESQPEPQDRTHLLVGLRVAASPDSPNVDVYLLDFNAMALGIEANIEVQGNKFFLVAGWSTDLRRDYPLVYRSARIFRDQDYMNQWAQLWPEICATSTSETQSPNLDIDRTLFASRVDRVEQAVNLALTQIAN